IRGVVTDPAGASIARTEVTIVNEKTGKSVKLLSDDVGRFVVRDLDEDKYRIKATAPGFTSFAKEHIDLGAKREVYVDILLQVAVSNMGGPMTAAPPKKRRRLL